MTLRLIAVLASVGASVTFGLSMLDWELRPLDVPSAMVSGALYLQPAVLMMLPRRRASLDLAAGIVAALLGVGPLLIPYALAAPSFIAVAVLSLVGAVMALWANSYSTSKGDSPLAILAVILTAGAMFATMIQTRSVCRYGSGLTRSDCAVDAVSYFGAASTVGALWLACLVVWLVAGGRRRESVNDPVSVLDPGR